MMKHRKRIMAAFLAVLLMASVLPMSAFATQSLASQSSTPKEEVVYINLNADGSVEEINIVNIFDLDEGGEIIDYGKYENVRNMTTTDIINYQNGMVTIDAGAGKLYYEGRLEGNVMPWTVSIKYFMDAKEYSADEIAGMSGRLGIKMQIRQNGTCDSSFFEGYALQVNLTLDTDKAANITADGATIANVGGDKQITYTILPDKGAEIEMTADVTDFEMDGISINGIPLKLNIEVDDADLMERIADLQEATGKLDDGMESLNDGIIQMQNALTSLNAQSGALRSGSSDFKAALEQLQASCNNMAGVSPELSVFSAAVNTLVAEYQKLDGGMADYTDAVAQIAARYLGISDGAGELKDGTSAFKGETAGLDAEVSEKIDELLGSITGGDREIKSFASERNTEVSSVQFVIRTGKIQMKEAGQTVEEKEETLNFWQKFLKLFGYNIQNLFCNCLILSY